MCFMNQLIIIFCEIYLKMINVWWIFQIMDLYDLTFSIRNCILMFRNWLHFLICLCLHKAYIIGSSEYSCACKHRQCQHQIKMDLHFYLPVYFPNAHSSCYCEWFVDCMIFQRKENVFINWKYTLFWNGFPSPPSNPYFFFFYWITCFTLEYPKLWK